MYSITLSGYKKKCPDGGTDVVFREVVGPFTHAKLSRWFSENGFEQVHTGFFSRSSRKEMQLRQDFGGGKFSVSLDVRTIIAHIVPLVAPKEVKIVNFPKRKR